MERIKKHPISTFLGLFFIIAAFTLLFVKTNYDIPLWGLGLLVPFGVLLCFAKDRLVDILTLGLYSLVQDIRRKITIQK